MRFDEAALRVGVTYASWYPDGHFAFSASDDVAKLPNHDENNGGYDGEVSYPRCRRSRHWLKESLDAESYRLSPPFANINRCRPSHVPKAFD